MEIFRHSSKVRDDIREKILNGRIDEIDPAYHLLKVQIYQHLDPKTRKALDLDIENFVFGTLRNGLRQEIKIARE